MIACMRVQVPSGPHGQLASAAVVHSRGPAAYYCALVSAHVSFNSTSSSTNSGQTLTLKCDMTAAVPRTAAAAAAAAAATLQLLSCCSATVTLYRAVAQSAAAATTAAVVTTAACVLSRLVQEYSTTPMVPVYTL
eukprot:12694-Heterococcus_DN1.PRE.2